MFDKTDIITIATALIENCFVYEETGRLNGSGYYCIHCSGGNVADYTEYTHSLDCPVLIAKDILTNIKKVREGEI